MRISSTKSTFDVGMMSFGIGNLRESSFNLISDNILMDKTINLNCLGMRISSTKSTFDVGMMSFGNGNLRESSLNLIPYLAMNYKIR